MELLLSWTFEKKRESISSVSFENDDEDDDENKTYSSRGAGEYECYATKKKKRFSKAAS